MHDCGYIRQTGPQGHSDVTTNTHARTHARTNVHIDMHAYHANINIQTERKTGGEVGRWTGH